VPLSPQVPFQSLIMALSAICHVLEMRASHAEASTCSVCSGVGNLDLRPTLDLACGRLLVATGKILPKSIFWISPTIFSESKSGRTLPHEVLVPGGSSNMTVKNCCFACQAQGFNLAGVEYAQECC
jgi:hypothetical protein